MRFRYVIGFESDTTPVETLRGELDARSARQAALRGGRLALRSWPNSREFRSVVVVVEWLEAARPISCNDCPVFHRRQMSRLCVTENPARFPWVINTTLQQMIS